MTNRSIVWECEACNEHRAPDGRPIEGWVFRDGMMLHRCQTGKTVFAQLVVNPEAVREMIESMGFRASKKPGPKPKQSEPETETVAP